MGGKTSLYIKIIVAQILGYMMSVFLVQKVFLGPVPTVRAEFIHEVQELPSTAREYVMAMPTKIKEFASRIKAKKEFASKTPPPWVFEPLPGEVIPTTSGRYTGPTRTPRESPNYPLPTSRPGEVQPTSQPGQPRPTDQPEQIQPTRAPLPTRSPAQPTSAPADPSILEQDMLVIINQRRKAAGLQEMSFDGHLTNAARGHSQYMSGGSGRCGHVGASGSSPFDRAKTAGYNGQVIGETVACGYRTAQAAVDGWWSSPPHKAILMSQNGRQIGLGWSNNYQTALVAR